MRIAGWILTRPKTLRAAADLNLAWLEEPVRANDRYALSRPASLNIVPLGAGQMEQSTDRFALLCEAGVSFIQPNAVFAGGFGTAIDVAQRAEANGHTISPARGWDLLNLHWMCGAMKAGAVELHRAQARFARLLMPNGPALSNANLYVPDASGLGLESDDDAL
jgi:L-rhamnonate dehydratase